MCMCVSTSTGMSRAHAHAHALPRDHGKVALGYVCDAVYMKYFEWRFLRTTD